MQRIHRFGRQRIGTGALPGPAAVMQMTDPGNEFCEIADRRRVRAFLRLTFGDVDGRTPGAPAVVPPAPLVSVAFRVKYPSDRLQLFLLPMLRQRYGAWERVVATDGPDAAALAVVAGLGDARAARPLGPPLAAARPGLPV